jgi:HEAT repeat protein
VRIRAAWALAENSAKEPQALEVLTPGLSSIDVRVVETALEALYRYGFDWSFFFNKNKPAKLVSELEKTLRHANKQCRRGAASVLGHCEEKSESVIRGLTESLNDREKEVRSSAAFAFSYLGAATVPDRVFMELCDYMDSADSWNPRWLTCLAFDRLNRFPECVVKTLIAHVNDDDRQVRIEVATLLTKCPDAPRAKFEGGLIDFARGEGKYVGREDQVKAIAALGRLKSRSPAANELLQKALRDSHQEIREAAEQALRDGVN